MCDRIKKLSEEKFYQSIKRTKRLSKLFLFLASTWDCLVFGLLTYVVVGCVVFLCYVITLLTKVIAASDYSEPVALIGIVGICGTVGAAIYKYVNRKTNVMCDTI